MINGIINVYKEAGFTSFDVVAKLRGITKMRKIGHTGTLDPDATGVLPVCFGSATGLVEMLTDKTKEYEAEFILGKVSDTQDITGNILEEKSVDITKEELIDIINQFVGKIQQIPPMYSALKVNGQKLCDLARKGIEVERKPRDIEIFSIKIVDITIDEDTNKPIKACISVACSKGTYIRTLCHDIGIKAGCGAVMSRLTRVRSGEFTIDNAHTLSEIEEMVHSDQIDRIVTRVDECFGEYEAVYVSDVNLKRVQNGNPFQHKYVGEKIRVYSQDGQFMAVYKCLKKDDIYSPLKMFLS